MAVYLGNQHIKDLYFGETKIAEAYFGSVKVYPESTSFEEIPDSANSLAGDVLFYDNTEQKKIIFRASDFTGIDTSRYTPIGVVVVPGTHNVYGDGSCGVMSLKYMSYSSPDSGADDGVGILIPFGGGTSLIPSLPSLSQIPTGNEENGIPTGSSTEAHLPSDNFNNVQCLHDIDAYYHTDYYAPSPYLSDESRNPGYYQTSPFPENNCLSDFNGIKNNTIVLQLDMSQTDWKTSDSIINSSEEGYYPAVQCCWRYHTKGTQQGEWYLPAIGELGYLMIKVANIDNIISNINNIYNTNFPLHAGSSKHLSSTQISARSIRALYMLNGNITDIYKTSENIAVSFLKYNSSPTTPIESSLAIVMEPSLSFTNTFTTPNGLTLKHNNDYAITKMSQLEYDNYLNEDGFYPLTFGTEILQDFYFYDGLTVAYFGEITEDSYVAIPNGKVTIYDTSDYNFITGDYIISSSYELYELYLNNNVTNKEEVSLYAGHSIGRVGIVDSKGKEYKFEFRIPSTPPSNS